MYKVVTFVKFQSCYNRRFKRFFESRRQDTLLLSTVLPSFYIMITVNNYLIIFWTACNTAVVRHLRGYSNAIFWLLSAFMCVVLLCKRACVCLCFVSLFLFLCFMDQVAFSKSDKHDE